MKTLSFYSFLLIAILFCSACDNDDTKNKNQENNSPQTENIGYVETNKTPLTVYNSIVSSLNANENISIVAEVDHAANAQTTESSLSFTRTVYFGNPALGTPLMQDNIEAGLDLPQRISVYVDEDGDTVMAYNSIEYIIDRHQLGTVSTTDGIATALSNLVNSATGEDVILNAEGSLDSRGVISVSSNNDFDTTYNNILSTLEGIENIAIVAELDHQANAQTVEMDLMPTKLIIFGNPALGTPLMSESKITALDLPQKMLVYQDVNGEVKILYNDPVYIATRHHISSDNPSLANISEALENISAAGASEE